MKNDTGFTLIEMLVAVVLTGIVGGSIFQLLNINQRVYREQAQRVEMNANVRAAISIIQSELRELNAGDSLGSDIVSLSSTQITYKAMRNLYFLCDDPDVGANRVSVSPTPWYGLRGPSTTTDSVLIYADNDTTTRTDDRWIHANLQSTASGTRCPGSSSSFDMTLSGVSAPGLAAVWSGAPLRTFEVVQMLLYASGDASWLGTRLYSGGSWGSIEPILGPLKSSTGIQFTYYTASGATTTTPANVARIKIVVNGQTAQKVRRGSSGGLVYAEVNLETHVALRNNPRY